MLEGERTVDTFELQLTGVVTPIFLPRGMVLGYHVPSRNPSARLEQNANRHQNPKTQHADTPSSRVVATYGSMQTLRATGGLIVA